MSHGLIPFGAQVRSRLSPGVMAAADELLLDENGRMRALPASWFKEIPHESLQVWASERGRYQFPTEELVEWLRKRIGGRKCVEIGAGYGDVGRNVGWVTLTDSYFQTSDAMRLIYGGLKCATITPPPDVMKRDGVKAAVRYQPDVCLACWVTQLYHPGDEEIPGVKAATGSCIGGVEFDEVLANVGELIFVGNLAVHGGMRLLALPHEEFSFPWLVSRAHDQSLNRIWVWKGGRVKA